MTAAFMAQHNFFINRFSLIIKDLQSNLHLDHHYLGQICGNLCNGNCFIFHQSLHEIVKINVFFNTVVEFEEISKMGITNPSSVKDFIRRGFSTETTDLPQFVSFLVPRKHSTDEKKKKKFNSISICAYSQFVFMEMLKTVYKIFSCISCV